MLKNVTGVKYLINGLVQGVGFRPTIAKVAQQLNLHGWVKNTSQGVEVLVVGERRANFIAMLENSLPRIASLDSVSALELALESPPIDFQILPSSSSGVNDTVMPPDSYVCVDCLRELFDPQSRFYLYPFINCTNCGPRYTVIKGLPYDRESTALADFPLCPACQDDYQNPADRRYHAQATACCECGPQYASDLAQVAGDIRAGKIVALKGVGGYVLLADATNSEAVQKLRERKRRPAKPFALMALNSKSIVAHFADVSEHEAGLLESAAAPIVLLKRRQRAQLAAEVAPGLNTLGIMLPSSPAFYVLFYYLLGEHSGSSWLYEAHNLALIATSANLSGGAIISDDTAARAALATIADSIVSFDREIVMKSDDSLVLTSGEHDVILRRGRGLAPKPYYFPYALPEVLGLGANLKNTLTFIRGNKAFSSQYLGDMGSMPTINYFKQVLAHYQQVFNFAPQLVVTDLHPDFFVTQFAESLNLPHIKLQHHFAHLAATVANAECCGKHLSGDIMGCVLDGYGYGLAGEAWGGELIKFNRESLEFEVVSHLMPLLVPGGDQAEREPWRIAVGLCVENQLALPPHLAGEAQAERLVSLINHQQFATATGFGRCFSGVAALLNVVTHASYEAEAALRLESLVTVPEVDYDFTRMTPDGRPDIHLLIRRIYQIGIVEKDLKRAVNVFYGSVTALIEKWIVFHCSLRQLHTVAISGGCWQSRFLLSTLSSKLRQLGIELLVPYQMPLNDECISFGQAWYGAQKLILESAGENKCV